MVCTRDVHGMEIRESELFRRSVMLPTKIRNETSLISSFAAGGILFENFISKFVHREVIHDENLKIMKASE